MKSEERQALQQNELEQEYVGHLKPFLERYGRLVALVAVAVVLLFVAVSVFRGSSQASREAGWAGLFEARNVGEIESVAEIDADTNAAVWAHLRAGNEFLASASRSAYSNREAAKDELTSARKHFEAALAIEDAPSAALAQARYGLANVEEATSTDDAAAAKAEYERLIEDYPQSPLVPAAERRLEILNRASTGPFLAWFDKQNPQPENLVRPLDSAPAEGEADDAPIPGVEPPPAPENPPASLTPDVPSVEEEDAAPAETESMDDAPAPAATGASEEDASEEDADDAAAAGGE